MTEETSLGKTLQNINSKLGELIEQKKIEEISFWSRLKFWNNVSKPQVRRNWVQIIYIQDNKNLKILKAPIDENVIIIDGIPHTIDAGDILLHKGKPTIIVPAWSIKPLSPEQNIKDTKESGNLTTGWEYIMNKMKKDMIKNIKNTGVMMWIIAGIVVIGGLYYVIKSGMLG